MYKRTKTRHLIAVLFSTSCLATHALASEPDVIDINAPDANGISLNQYENLHVGYEGRVLNNNTEYGSSVLAGEVRANANLGDKPADVIIEEMWGTSRSRILGAIEISGPKADYILANPNGITCQGCGFINTRTETLATGQTAFSEQGKFMGIDVQGGDIIIEETIKASALQLVSPMITRHQHG